MFWADKIAKTIIDSGKYKPYWVDDMKTPSGRVHVGSLRGVIIHDLVYRALKDAGVEATFTYVFEDHDPMDGMPHYLDAKQWSKYMGQPLFTIPSPDGKAKNYGEYYALEFQEVFNKSGCKPKIIWMSEVYKSGKMNDLVKLCLDNAAEIRKIYAEMYKKSLPENWYPFQVVCPKCGKESTTKVSDWDGKEVTYVCNVDGLDWTKGCGSAGRISPLCGDGKFVGKLPWKVEWPVKWKTIGVTVEGAGKDHMSAGGSHDVAKEICKRVIHYPVPYPVGYEFFLIGGKKMSSSKGLGSSAKEVSDILPPYLLRFLFARTDYNQAIDFDPVGNMYIPDLFDEYDRCWQAFNTDAEPDLARAFVMAQISELPKKETDLFLPRFRDVANFLQLPNIDIKQKFSEIKGSELNTEENKILEERARFARIWIEKYAPDEYRLQMKDAMPEEAKTLTEAQKEFLNKTAELLEKITDPDKLQFELFELTKNMGISPKVAFAAIYQVFIGKTHGPRAAWFLLQYPKEKVIQRLREASNQESSKSKTKINSLNKPEYFSISNQVKTAYPSISVGMALIKNVQIKKTDVKLEIEKTELLDQFRGLTTEVLGKYPEVISYRKLYKQMGIDWHSRRPSPEALLRRVVLGKGLYTVNTCVDAYNLVVMKHRISVGAFDADLVKFPTVLQFAKANDEILLLGDSEPTKYTEKELAYYDQEGGYNIDFNYRDAQRTKVTETTKNIWINVDGIYEITPEQVQQVLDESVEKIIYYCGGEVEFKGIVK